MENVPPLLFKVLRSRPRVARNMRCPHTKINQHDFSDSVLLSAKFVSVCAVPCLFWSGPEEWPMSERESSCIVGHIDGSNNTNLFVLQTSPYDVTVHRHEGDSSFELFWCTLHFTHHSWDLGEKLQRGESWEMCPLEFHGFSIDSIQFSVLARTLEPHPFIFSIQHSITGKGVQNLRIHRFMPSKIWFLRHSIKIVFPVEKFANKFVTLPRFLLLALESVFVTPRTTSWQWGLSSPFPMECKFVQVVFPKKTLRSWLKTQTFPTSTNACRDLPFYPQDDDSSLFRNPVCTLSMSGINSTEVSYSCGVSKSISRTESPAKGFPVPVIDLTSVCLSW